MRYHPWYKATYTIRAGANELKLDVPHDVFSTLRIDEGTELLLAHLPEQAPRRVLDVGCGYGALGLPVAARYPTAHVEMIDRDRVAVTWAEHNARKHDLAQVRAYASLGYRDLHEPGRDFDWILCNVPARIGRPFIEYLFVMGRTRLSTRGEIRVVVITDLAPVLRTIALELDLPIMEIAKGPRHVVFSLLAQAIPANSSASQEPHDLYLRDQVEIAGLRLDRPFDLGGDDPMRLTRGWPVLIDALPRRSPTRVLCFRAGYGVLPLLALSRWPDSRVTAIDRDLLATTYISRNARRMGMSTDRLVIRESAHWPDVIPPDERFELIAGELSPGAGMRVAHAEIDAAAKCLAPGGEALLLCLQKLEPEWLTDWAAKRKHRLSRVISRDQYSVLSLRGA